MKKIISIVLFFISAGNCFAQQVTFQKTFGGTGTDSGNSVQQTTDGGYIITGITNSFGAGYFDVYLIKTNINGDTLWTKTFGGTDIDYGYSVQQTTDGGYIIAGITASFGAGIYDVYLIKTDANGDSLWTKTFGGTSDDWGLSVQQTVDGGYVITGRTQSFGAGNYDIYLIKADANGNLQWTKTFGGTNSDWGFSSQQTTDGGYIITGYTESFGAGFFDTYLIKTDANGDTLWTKTFGGTDSDEGRWVQQTADGGFIVAGGTGSFGAGGFGGNIYLIKTDSNGNSLWSKTFGGLDNDYASFVQQTIDGGYIITGETQSFGAGYNSVYLVKTNGNGDSLWIKLFGGSNVNFANSVQQTSDEGYIICCNTNSFGAGSNDVYLIKTDSLGNSGCNESSTATIATTAATQVSSPVTIATSPPTIVTTPATIVGSGGTVTILCSTVGIQSEIPNSKSTISISPNPTTNKFTITFPNTINKGSIEIYNVLGKKIFTENISNVSQKEIHLKNINAGIYFVKVKDGEKEYCKKLMIE